MNLLTYVGGFCFFMDQEILKKELSVRSIIELSFKTLINNIKIYSIIVLIFNLPLYLYLFLVDISFDNFLSLESDQLLTIVLLSLITLFADILVIRVTNSIITNGSIKLNKLLKNSTDRIFPFFTTSLLVALYAQGLSMILIIPGIVFLIYVIFFGQIVVLRNYSLYEAIVFSFEIVYHKWWKVLGGTIAIIIISLVLTTVLDLAGFNSTDNFIPTFISYISTVASSITTIFFTILFLNLEATNNY